MTDITQPQGLIPTYTCPYCNTTIRQDDSRKKYQLHNDRSAHFIPLTGLDLKVGEVFGIFCKQLPDSVIRAVIDGIPEVRYNPLHERVYFMTFYHLDEPENVFARQLQGHNIERKVVPSELKMRELDKEEFDQFRYRLLEDASKNPKLVKHVEEFARIYGRRLHLKKLTRGIIHK